MIPQSSGRYDTVSVPTAMNRQTRLATAPPTREDIQTQIAADIIYSALAVCARSWNSAHRTGISKATRDRHMSAYRREAAWFRRADHWAFVLIDIDPQCYLDCLHKIEQGQTPSVLSSYLSKDI